MKTLLYTILIITLVTYGCGSEEQQESNDRTELIPDQDPEQSPENPAQAIEEPKLDPGQYVKISTYYGDMYITLHDATPLHKENFLKLVEEGYYDSTTFHRVIDGFMVQGGDPNSKDDDPLNDGQGGPGYTIPAEINDTLKHIRGAVAAARTGGPSNPEKRSSGSQFYVVENHDGTPQLDGDYTVFGQVVKGLDVPDKICMQKKGEQDRPLKNIYMKAEIVEIPADSL